MIWAAIQSKTKWEIFICYDETNRQSVYLILRKSFRIVRKLFI